MRFQFGSGGFCELYAFDYYELTKKVLVAVRGEAEKRKKTRFVQAAVATALKHHEVAFAQWNRRFNYGLRLEDTRGVWAV